MASITIRFAQISDIHLGRHFGGGRLGLTPAEAQLRRDELYATLEQFADSVESEQTDVCFIPGDIFDSATPATDDINRVIAAINRLAPRPVFICPGNHDPYSRTSVYNTASALYAERATDAPRWGEHVHLATSPEFRSVRVGDLHVAMQAFYADTRLQTSALNDVPSPQADAVNVLLFHGTFLLAEGLSSAPATMPFTQRMLEDTGYDYAAVGHNHAPREIRAADGRLLGAYAGAPLAMDSNDLGERGFILGTLSSDAGVADVEIRRVRTDPRVIHALELNVTGLSTNEEARAAAERILVEVKPEDLVTLTLTGRKHNDVDAAALAPLVARYFKGIVEDTTETEHAVDLSTPQTGGRDAASRLRARMAARWQECTTDDERRRAEEATAYALDALTKGEVTLR